jgi:hypothetical protein
MGPALLHRYACGPIFGSYQYYIGHVWPVAVAATVSEFHQHTHTQMDEVMLFVLFNSKLVRGRASF